MEIKGKKKERGAGKEKEGGGTQYILFSLFVFWCVFGFSSY